MVLQAMGKNRISRAGRRQRRMTRIYIESRDRPSVGAEEEEEEAALPKDSYLDNVYQTLGRQSVPPFAHFLPSNLLSILP